MTSTVTIAEGDHSAPMRPFWWQTIAGGDHRAPMGRLPWQLIAAGDHRARIERPVWRLIGGSDHDSRRGAEAVAAARERRASERTAAKAGSPA